VTRRLIRAEAVRTAKGILGDALLVEDGRVAAIGSSEDLTGEPMQGYPGAVIVPGLRDAHFHPIPYAATLQRTSLKDAGDLDEVLRRLRLAAGRLPPGSPLVANRLDDEALEEKRLPTRFDLDQAVRDRPLLIYRYCGHIGMANTAALEAAGLRPDTPDPSGGSFDRHEDGSLSGVLRETAVQTVAASLAGSTPIQPEQVLQAMSGLSTLGLTGMTAIVSLQEGPWCGTEGELRLLEEIAPDLPLRLSVLVIPGGPHDLEESARLLGSMGPWVSFLGMKAFADGSLGGHTAALREAYLDRPGERGTLRLDPAATSLQARITLGLGSRVAVHAIGDLANAAVLDLFEDLLERGAAPESLRVEHASVLADEDVERFAATGITASVQPAFLPSETAWLEKRLGPRLRQAYRWRTLAEAGVPLAGGSDCPVEPPSPLWGMAAARDRAGMVPEEGLSPEQALALFTNGAARAMGEPEPLASGSPADFVVLDRDPVACSPDELRQAKVLATWVDGGPVSLPEQPVTWTA
jgi:predicted amidohydrolase YtcJ